MNSKNILFITYENPLSKDNGDRIYTSNFLVTLLDLKYKIDVLCYDSNNIIDKNYETIISHKSLNIHYVKFNSTSKLKIIFSLLPAMIVNRKSKTFSSCLKSMLLKNKYDYIFVNHFKMVFTLKAILKSCNQSKLIYISHNSEYLLSLNNAKNSKSIIDKLIYWQDAIKTKLYEKKWLHHFDSITTISEYDQDYYELNFKNLTTCVIRPVFEIDDLSSKNNKNLNEIILVGSFIWGPKSENMLSFLNSKNFENLYANNIYLTIVGNADPLLVDKINSNYKGVYMTGRVKSVSGYYAKSKIAIVPELLGGGFKLKIAEAALSKTAIFAVKGAITKCNLTKDIHYIEAADFDDLIIKIIDYQKREFEIDILINKAYDIAVRDFSQKKINLDISKLL